MKTERDFGRAFAEVNHGEPGFTGPVNIDKMLESSRDIPPDDYRAMKDAGILKPNARAYWEGFNSFFTEPR